MSQASLSILAKVQASTPLIEPFANGSGSAGSTSIIPGEADYGRAAVRDAVQRFVPPVVAS